MKIISKDLRDGEKLPERHVFNGMGYQGIISLPHLAWDDVPAGNQSFVVTCYDPDAPTGSGWWHWIVANLPADTRVLPQGSVPIWLLCLTVRFERALTLAKRATAARRRQRETHRYIFTVHALDVDKIEVRRAAMIAGFNVHFHSLSSASITTFVKPGGGCALPAFRTRRPDSAAPTGHKT